MATLFRRAAMTAACASILSLAAAFPAQAQATGSSGTTTSTSRASGPVAGQEQSKYFNMRASQLIGKEVRNDRGEKLGKIEDLFVDAGAQRVPYAALSFDAGIASKDKLFAFPMTAFSLSRDRGELLLNVAQDRLRTAPGFPRDSWPDHGNASYFDEVNRFFGGGDRRQQAGASGMLRGSELIGRDVNDRKGGDAGEVQDFVVDIAQGRVSYVVLDFEKGWSLGGKLLPLPLSALSFPKERGGDLVLNIERERLDMARGFEQNAWPDLNSPAFDQQMRAYFLALERPPAGGGSSGSSGSSSGGTK